MSSWGGTLGVEVSPLKNLGCRPALTALYGDLTTCCISAFGQYRQSAWTHTQVASLGLSHISPERKVSQSMDSMSPGLGARVQNLAGESAFNRSALMEGRVLAKFNGGDRRSTASVSLANAIGLAGVESAAIGVFGIGLGAVAGLTVPLSGDAGSICMGCELRTLQRVQQPQRLRGLPPGLLSSPSRTVHRTTPPAHILNETAEVKPPATFSA